MDDHQTYRKFVQGFPDKTTEPDLSWKYGWDGSSEDYLSLVEDGVYGCVFDPAFKTAIKNGRSPAEVLDYTMIKERLTVINEKITLENCKSSDGTKEDTGASGSTTAPNPARGDPGC